MWYFALILVLMNSIVNPQWLICQEVWDSKLFLLLPFTHCENKEKTNPLAHSLKLWSGWLKCRYTATYVLSAVQQRYLNYLTLVNTLFPCLLYYCWCCYWHLIKQAQLEILYAHFLSMSLWYNLKPVFLPVMYSSGIA